MLNFSHFIKSERYSPHYSTHHVRVLQDPESGSSWYVKPTKEWRAENNQCIRDISITGKPPFGSSGIIEFLGSKIHSHIGAPFGIIVPRNEIVWINGSFFIASEKVKSFESFKTFFNTHCLHADLEGCEWVCVQRMAKKLFSDAPNLLPTVALLKFLGYESYGEKNVGFILPNRESLFVSYTDQQPLPLAYIDFQDSTKPYCPYAMSNIEFFKQCQTCSVFGYITAMTFLDDTPHYVRSENAMSQMKAIIKSVDTVVLEDIISKGLDSIQPYLAYEGLRVQDEVVKHMCFIHHAMHCAAEQVGLEELYEDCILPPREPMAVCDNTTDACSQYGTLWCQF